MPWGNRRRDGAEELERAARDDSRSGMDRINNARAYGRTGAAFVSSGAGRFVAPGPLAQGEQSKSTCPMPGTVSRNRIPGPDEQQDAPNTSSAAARLLTPTFFRIGASNFFTAEIDDSIIVLSQQR